MTEKLPQKINQLETTEKRPPIEGVPVVESMQVRYAGVLVKVTFPRPESVAKIFMLVQEPTSEQGTKNVEQLLKEMPEENKKWAEHTFEVLNSPSVVFRSHEEAQKWFDMISFEPSERKAVADFLEVENKEE